MLSGVTWHMRRSEAPTFTGFSGRGRWIHNRQKEISVFLSYNKKSIREAFRIGILRCCPTFATMVRGRGVSTTQFGRLSARTFHFSVLLADAISSATSAKGYPSIMVFGGV